MDSRNVIAAISLSAAVIILYSLWFSPSAEDIKQNDIKQEQVQKETNTPSIDKNENFEKISRQEALKENETFIKLKDNVENGMNINVKMFVKDFEDIYKQFKNTDKVFSNEMIIYSLLKYDNEKLLPWYKCFNKSTRDNLSNTFL